MNRCRHCGHKVGTSRRRGLCYRCRQSPEIVALYPRKTDRRTLCEPTETELEALIAERRANLPGWWQEEDGQPEPPQVEIRVYRVRADGVEELTR